MLLRGFQVWLSGKEYTCQAGDTGDKGLIPGLGRFSGGGHGHEFKNCMEGLETISIGMFCQHLVTIISISVSLACARR